MKYNRTVHNPLIASVAAISINFAAAVNVLAEPVIDFHNPYKPGNNKDIALDCAPLKKHFTCGFAEQLDGQEICEDNKILEQTRQKTSTESEAEKLAGNLAMINAISHNGIMHRHCTAQYSLTVISSILKDTDRKIKTNQEFSPSELESIKTRLRDVGRIKINPSVDPNLRDETEQILSAVSERILEALEENPHDYLPIMHNLVPVLKDRQTWQQLDECIVLDAVQACRAEL